MTSIFKIKNFYTAFVIVFLILSIFSPISASAAVGCPSGQIYSTTEGRCVSSSTFFTGGPNTTPADACSSLTGLGNLICKIKELLNSIIPALVLLGLTFFIWGVVRYVIADGEEAKKRGKDQMIYGIIGFTVIVGVWGLVNIITSTFGLSGNAIKPIAPELVDSGSVASAGSCPAISTTSKFSDVLNYFTCVIDRSVIPFIFAVAMVFFIWGAVKFFIIDANEEAKREQGKQFMLWGIIALAVMISVWGLVKILAVTFGIDTTFLPKVKP